MIFDCHTHSLRRNALIDIDPVNLLAASSLGRPCDAGPVFERGYLYSVGIHPWNVGRVTPAALRLLRALAAEPQVRAIGECGFDTLRVVPPSGSDSAQTESSGQPAREEIIEMQTALLRVHFELSERLSKTMILHVVKAFPEIIRLRDAWRPTQPWIIHGFRGKPQLARELLAHGFYLSYGLRFNPASLALTPPERRLRETDCEPFPLLSSGRCVEGQRVSPA